MRFRRAPLSGAVLVRVVHAAYQVFAVSRFGQTLGHRALGIHVVAQENNGVPTLKQAAVRWSVASIPDALAPLLADSGNNDRFSAVMRDLQPEVERLRQQHRGHRHGLNEALIALYKERDTNPTKGCLPSLLPVLASFLSSCLLHAPRSERPATSGVA